MYKPTCPQPVVFAASLAGVGADLYWHPVCSKHLWETAPVMQPGLYTHVKSVLIYAPLPPCTRGHRAGSVWLRLSHVGADLYWHPVCSKHLWETAPVMQPGLYTHVKSVLIYAPLPPCTRGHRAGSVWLRLSHVGATPCCRLRLAAARCRKSVAVAGERVNVRASATAAERAAHIAARFGFRSRLA